MKEETERGVQGLLVEGDAPWGPVLLCSLLAGRRADAPQEEHREAHGNRAAWQDQEPHRPWGWGSPAEVTLHLAAGSHPKNDVFLARGGAQHFCCPPRPRGHFSLVSDIRALGEVRTTPPHTHTKGKSCPS